MISVEPIDSGIIERGRFIIKEESSRGGDKMRETLNYEEDIKIDPTALDVEWLEQAELMRKYSKHSADMKKVMDEAKERLDFKKACIEMDIRNAPENYGLSKVTEGAIQSAILLQEEYQKLAKEYGDARYEYDVSVGAVRAMDQRKSALENLVKLLSASYFAGPQAPRNLYQEHLSRMDQRKQNTKVRLKRTRKGQED